MPDRADHAALRELIVSSLALAERYEPGSRDERIYELILDEIRGMTVLPFGLLEPRSEARAVYVTRCGKCRKSGAASRRRKRAI